MSATVQAPPAESRLRILHLEDTPTDAELVKAELTAAGIGFEALRVATRDAFAQGLENFRPEIVLLDFELPSFNGAEALQLIQEQFPDVPALMVTGALGEERAVWLLRLGARDFIHKNRLERLGPAVLRVLAEEQEKREHHAAERALAEREKQYHTLADSGQALIWTTGVDGDCDYFNAPWLAYTGQTLEHELGQGWTKGVHPEDLSRCLSVYADGADRCEPFSRTYRLRRHDGEYRWLQDDGSPRYDRAGAFIGYIGHCLDVTDRIEAAARIEQLSRLYATLSQTNQAIVRTGNVDQLFNLICRSSVIHGDFALAWVGLLDEHAQRIRPVCHYGAEPGFDENLSIPVGPGATPGAIANAIALDQVTYAHDGIAATLPASRPSPGSRSHGRATAVLPLSTSGHVVGVLVLESARPGFFDGEMQSLLRDMAADVSYALGAIEQSAQRNRAQAEREHAICKLRRAVEDCIGLAASITEMRDPYTAGHQRRVSDLAVAIARDMGLSSEVVDGIHFGALIHDVGKIGIPSELLTKPTALTRIERLLIQEHARAGYEILKDIQLPWPISQMILQHHERLDGTGYPVGLKGDQILLEARIIAVADTVEAMSANRPYRLGLGIDAALDEIAAGSGVRYDATVAGTCIALVREKGFSFTH